MLQTTNQARFFLLQTTSVNTPLGPQTPSQLTEQGDPFTYIFVGGFLVGVWLTKQILNK